MTNEDYKKFNREVKGYVDVAYDIAENATTLIEFGYSYSGGDKVIKIIEAENTQELNEVYTTPRVLENYAVLYSNYTLLDGSFMLFNKKFNESGFYSNNIISNYKKTADNLNTSFDGFYFFIGNSDNPIKADTQGITIYFKSNKVVGSNIRATLYKNNYENIYEAREIINYGNSLFITFDERVKDGSIVIENLFFEYDDRRIIISHIDLGLSHVYINDELVDFTVTEEVDKLVEETPANELDVTIGDYEQLYDPLNPTGIANYLTKKVKYTPHIGIVLENGQTKYTKMGEFFFDSIDYQDKQVTITAYNLINELTDVMIKNTKGSLGGTSAIMTKTDGCTIQDKILSVLENSYDYKYEINLPTEMMLTVTWMKKCSLLSFLQKCCMYNGILYVNRDNAIVVKEIDKNIKNILTKYELLSDIKYYAVNNYKSYYDKREYISGLSTESSSSENDANNFSVTFTLKSEEEEICVSSDDPRDLAFIYKDNISFSGADSVEMLTNSLSSDMNPFYYLVFLKVKGQVGNTVTISGKKPYVTKYDSKSELKKLYGEDENTNIILDNDLCLAYKQSDTFIDKMYGYKISCSYNGDPNIKAGDYIEVESDYGYVPIFVTKHSLTFDGGLSGTIEGVE